MKKIYADLHLCANLNDREQMERMIKKAVRLGYRQTAIPISRGFSEHDFQQLKTACAETGMDLVSRVDLRPRTSDELLRDLRRVRRNYEVVAVMCDSKNVARQAAKDRRVDVLNFPAVDFHWRFFDLAEAELASSSLASLEVDIQPLLTLDGSARSKLLSSLRREAATAKAFHVPIIMSSGVSDERLMRKPLELAALASLFDMNEISALEAVSKNPATVVKRNREKLDSKFVAPGIRVVRRGKDC